MRAVSRFAHWTRCNLTMQGYGAMSEDDRRRMAVALRVAPALCLAGMTTGIALRSPALVMVMAASAFVGGFVTAKHPFDLVWDHGLRRVVGGPAVPATPPPRRFACQLATAWLLGIAAAFLAGAETAGIALGVPLILVAATVTTTNWCLPSLIYGLAHRVRPKTSTA